MAWLRSLLETSLDRTRVERNLQWGLSVFISLVLWGLSLSGETFTVTHTLPVVTEEPASGYTILSPRSPDSVEVVFRGRGVGVLRDQLAARPHSIRVPVQDVLDGGGDYPRTEFIELGGQDVWWGGGDSPWKTLDAGGFSPQAIEVRLDLSAERSVPVRVTSSGEMPSRYLWRLTNPDSVRVSGAASVVTAMDSCTYGPVTPGEAVSILEPEVPSGITEVQPEVRITLVAPVPVIPPGGASSFDASY